MEVFFHPGNYGVNKTAFFDKGQQLFIEIAGIATEIIIGIDADNGIETLFFKGKVQSVGLNRRDLLRGKPHAFKKGNVLLGFAPKIGGGDFKTVFLGEKSRGKPLSAAEIADFRPLGDLMLRHELFRQLNGIGTHHHGHQFRCFIFFRKFIFQCSFLRLLFKMDFHKAIHMAFHRVQ